MGIFKYSKPRGGDRGDRRDHEGKPTNERFLGVIACAMLAASACGGNTSGPGPGATSSTTYDSGSTSTGSNAALAAFASSYCSLLTPCCAQFGLSAKGDQCSALVQTAGAVEGFNAALAPGCLAAARQVAGQPGFCAAVASSMSTSVPACDNIFSMGSGAAGPGQACTTDSDCAAPTTGTAQCNLQEILVDGGGNALSGTCIELLRGQAGQACIGTVTGGGTSLFFTGATSPTTDYVCYASDGLLCNLTTRVCSPPAATGASCEQDSDCVAADYCGADQKCAPRVANGATCTGSTGFFMQGSCATTSFCDTATMTCKPLLQGGAPCMTNMQCSSQQCVNSACESSTSGLVAVCSG
jgi:hypothetical protein